MSAPDEASAERRWTLVQELFAEALELQGDERARLLDARCAEDAELRSEVESLLAAATESDAYFQDLAGRAGMTLSTDDEPGGGEAGEGVVPDAHPPVESDPHPGLVGSRVGQYEVLEWLGRGGMASVYLAERKGEGFTQRVALKLALRRFTDPLIQRRSNEERRILARLEHRNIARLIDGGLTPEGYPFYAMEYVEGTDLLSYCDARRLGVKERLRVFLEVCAPVQFAHERLVVHCDLKPSNIFVTEDGHVRLLDFGVARLIDPDAAGDEATGLWFTPAYASPEQVRRERPGTASDVYALGVLLYELLTGRRPYRFADHSRAEVARTVGERIPRPPSEVVGAPPPEARSGGAEARPGLATETLAAARASTPGRLRKRLRGDLDAIVMKALAKDPGDRYHTAEQLAADVRRHLSHRPLAAVEHTSGYRVEKFVRRNRGAVAAAGLVVLALGTGLGATLWQASRATSAAELAREEAEKAELVASLMTDMFRLSDPNELLGDTITARDLLDRGTERIRSEFGDQPDVQARLLAEVARVYRNLGLYRRAEPLARQALDLRVAELGPLDLETNESRIQVGGLLADLGRQAEAIDVLAAAIEERTPLVTFPDSVLVHAQGTLAWLVRATQRHEWAAELFGSALAGYSALDPRGAGAADMTFGLAATYHDSGLLDAADSLLRSVLDVAPDARPTPMALGALRNVGMIRRVRAQYREAEPLLRTAVDMSETLYGPSHREVFESKQELGLALAGAGAWVEAEGVLQEALRGATELLGPLHQVTAGLQEALGSLYVDQRRFEEAVPLHEASLQEKIERHQRDHPGIVSSLARVAEALEGAGRDAEAAAYVERARGMASRISPDPSVYAISWERTLGRIAATQGDAVAAEEHFARAVELAERLLDRPDHRYTVWAKRDYALFLVASGRRGEGAELLEWVLEAQVRTLGEPHPTIDRTRAELRAARRG